MAQFPSLRGITCATLVTICYFLTPYPSHVNALFSELLATNTDPPHVTEPAQLPYLNRVINEVFRLAPTSMTLGDRLTSLHGLWVDDVFLPPGRRVVVTKSVTRRRE
jgi:cytochrome P450